MRARALLRVPLQGPGGFARHIGGSEGLYESLYSYLLKISQVILGAVVAVILARLLGAEGYGIYSLAMSVVQLCAIPALLGLPQLVVRETAQAEAEKRWSDIRGLWAWSAACVLVSISAVAVTSILVVELIVGHQPRSTAFLIGLLLAPLMALGNLRGAALQGLGRVFLGQTPEWVVRPALFALLLPMMLSGPLPRSPESAMAVHVVAAALSFAIGAVMLHRARPAAVATVRRGTYRHRRWVAAAVPLALVSGLQVVNAHAGVVILGIFRDDTEVGFYRGVTTIGAVVAFGAQSLALVVAPQIARLHARGELVKPREIIRATSRYFTFLSLPPALAIVAFPRTILELTFGTEFGAADVSLVIVTAGAAFTMSQGPLVVMLNMTGNERSAAKGLALGVVTNVGAGFALVPWLGMEGAALATVMGQLVWTSWLQRAVRRLH